MRTLLCVAACLALTVFAVGISADQAFSGQSGRHVVYSGGGSGSSTDFSPMLSRVASRGESPAEPLLTAPPLKAMQIFEAIQKRHGDPLPGYVGGRTFHNREGRLPSGRYREYDVNPKSPGRNRGPERVVIEQRTGKAYYTGDHYVTFIPLN